MKAYILRVINDDDQGQVVVFANTANEAKKQFNSTYLETEQYIDIRVKRSPEFDNMENLSEIDLAKEQWRNGWRWYDYNTPYPEDTTDEEFYKWYKNNVLGVDDHE